MDNLMKALDTKYEPSFYKVFMALDCDSDNKQFLEKAMPHITKCLEGGKVGLDELPFIHKAYRSVELIGVDKFMQSIEEYAIDRFDALTADQAAKLVTETSIQSAELLEICEKLIGLNID